MSSGLIPLAGGSTFLGTGTGAFSSGTGFLGASGTLKISKADSENHPDT